MSGESRDQALQHLDKAESELGRGRYSDALQTLEKAGRLADEAQAPDVISLVIGAVAYAMQSAGRYDEALKRYTIALKIQEELAEHDPFFNTWVATTLNNLGLLLSRMGRIDDAKERYERALKMYEELLEGDSGNVTYQSLDLIILLFRLGCSGLAGAMLTHTIPKYIYG